MSLVMGRRLVFTGCALLLLGGLASAQTKVGVINLQRAVLESAEIKKKSTEMEAKYRPRQQQIESLEKEMAAISEQLQGGKVTAQQQADLQAQGTRKQREHDRLAEDLQNDVNAERNEILSKSTQMMSAVVKKLAEEKTLDVVIDISNAVYYKPALEITSDAIAAYDQAHPAK